MYYMISFLYNQEVLYGIWVSDDEDYIITQEEKILIFNTIDDLNVYEQRHDISCKKNEVIQYDIDKFILWCGNEKSINCNCDDILNFWNICSDVSKSVKKHFIGNEPMYDYLYEKIFSANDLFGNNNVSYSTLLEFSYKDIISLKKVIRNGIEIIIDNMG